MKEDSIRESVELIDDEDLDLIAGGQGLNIGVSVDVNIAAIEQVIQQIQVFGSNAAAAAGAAHISQISRSVGDGYHDNVHYDLGRL